MAIEFKKNKNYFRDILTQQDKTIYASDLDAQFNDISAYLNITLKPLLDSLVSSAVAGVIGQEGAFVCNIGDGTTAWQLLEGGIIGDSSLLLRKLAQVQAGSVIGSDNTGELQAITATARGQVLAAGEDALEWRRLRGTDIADDSLTGRQIGLVGQENFAGLIFINEVADNSIATENIAAGAITNNKLADGTIESAKLGVFTDLPPLDSYYQFNTQWLADLSITAAKVRDGSIWFDLNFNTPTPIKYTHIKPESITDEHLVQLNQTAGSIVNGQPRAEAGLLIAGGGWKPLVPGFGLTAEHLEVDKLEKNYFTPEVQAAMEFFGA